MSSVLWYTGHILKTSSAEEKHSIEPGREKRGRIGEGKKGYNLQCSAKLKPDILPQSIDEKLFAHVL